MDYLALSFVRSPADVVGLKTLIAEEKKATPVIAKVEKPEAIDCIKARSTGIEALQADITDKTFTATKHSMCSC